MVKNSLCKAGDAGLIPGCGIKTPVGATEPVCSNCTPQRKIPHAASKTQDSQINK